MGLLGGKTILVTGILTDASLGFAIARQAQLEGATVIATGAGRSLSLTERVVRKLPERPVVVPLDVSDPAQIDEAAATVATLTDRLDGLVHAIGYAPPACLGHGILAASAPEAAHTFEISAYSMAALCRAFLPLLEAASGASVVGLDFDASHAWPRYDWMGVAKASLESLTRYLARDLGPSAIRVNLIAAGPIRTLAAKSIPGFTELDTAWADAAPLGWDARNATPVALATIGLLSDFFSATTGEIVHVDGGVHAVRGAV